MTKNVGIILLAAGQSKRFGSQKLLHVTDGEQTLLAQSHHIYAELGLPIVVVTDAMQMGLVDYCEAQPWQSINIDNASAGMSESLKAGITYFNDMDGWLIALGDMPNVQSATAAALLKLATRDKIIVPWQRTETGADRRQGNPVVIGADFRRELLSLKGDRGAKPILARYESRITWLETNDAGIYFDIDHPLDQSLDLNS
ncbi:MAG: nucleotidyltransferase family protein [Pseudomonadota bacterium]